MSTDVSRGTFPISLISFVSLVLFDLFFYDDPFIDVVSHNDSCPPRTFLPALCRILLDKTAPDSVLEVTARAITYYLDVSAECTRRVVAVDGAVKALCGRLGTADLQQRTSRDLAEQCVKVTISTFLYLFSLCHFLKL